jgi:opacity protein-like surface antigen
MITKRTLACLSIVSLLPFTSIAHAEMGPYVGIGAGFTKFNDDGFISDITDEQDDDWDDTGTAYRFIAGYKFSEHFSAEWTYQDYNYNEYDIKALSSVEMQAWHISALASYPIEESFLGKLDLYGKFGFGESDFRYKGEINFGDRDGDDEDEIVNVSEEQTAESLIFAAGAQFYINEDFRVRTELDWTTFELDDAFGTGPDTIFNKDYSFTAVSLTASVLYAF